MPNKQVRSSDTHIKESIQIKLLIVYKQREGSLVQKSKRINVVSVSKGTNHSRNINNNKTLYTVNLP